MEFRRVLFRSEEHTSELQSLTNLVFRLIRSEEHTSELQSLTNLVCRLLLEKKKNSQTHSPTSSGANGPHGYACQNSAVSISLNIVLTPFSASSFLPAFFFLKDAAPPEIYSLPLPDSLPI